MKKTFLVLSILSLFACKKKTEAKEINVKDSITIKKDTVKTDKVTGSFSRTLKHSGL